MYGALYPDGRLQYCNAGHNPPLVVGPTDFRRLERGGPIVGLFEGATYEEETITLNVGDWLIVYSDGVSEALSTEGEEYGEERILACVRKNLEHGAAGAARVDVRRRARLHPRRGAGRRHHRDGPEVPVIPRTRAERRAATLWLVLAIFIGNGIYDVLVARGIKEVLYQQALSEAAAVPPCRWRR